MLTSTNANVKLTAEQSLQILEWQQRLTVIQDEIRIAEKNKKSLEDEIDTKTKHNNYLAELETNLEREVAKLNEQKATLQNEVAASVATLAEHLTTTQERHTVLSRREQEVTDREAHAKRTHEQLKAREDAHADKTTKLQEHQLLVEKAHKAFLEAAKILG